MAGFNFSQNIIGLDKVKGDVHELEVDVANLSASVLSIAGDVQEIALEVSQLSASTLPYSSTQSTKEAIDEILCYKDFSLTFDSDGTKKYDNDSSIINVVGDYNKIIRAEVVNAQAGYVILMTTWGTGRYFRLKSSDNLSIVPNVTVNVRVYWISHIKSMN